MGGPLRLHVAVQHHRREERQRRSPCRAKGAGKHTLTALSPLSSPSTSLSTPPNPLLLTPTVSTQTAPPPGCSVTPSFSFPPINPSI